MKASVNDSVELLVDMPGETQSWQIPKGTRGVVVEVFQHPAEGYAVDVSLPDASSSTKFRYDNVMLEPTQFIVVRSE
ncbi:hypothetical protein QQ44_25855 [Mycolicibacterium setense]|uniref:DUF4926 domain-containing protein n=2 Tax=Mycolicibacterium setense TaxID=431269 RepID=A0ABR4YP24_9MYCO|nr:hypothetical protein QQ44_25855 [Mycolicibacterium setense]